MGQQLSMAVDGNCVLGWAVSFLERRGSYEPHEDDPDDEQICAALIACWHAHAEILERDLTRSEAALGSDLADYYEADLMDAYMASLPHWTCPCGADYRLLPGFAEDRPFFLDDEDTNHEKCPRCGLDLAKTRARRIDRAADAAHDGRNTRMTIDLMDPLAWAIPPSVSKIDLSDIEITDVFCGAGGSSEGARRLGLTPKLGLNHWNLACETYETNHHTARAVCADVMCTDPGRFPTTRVFIASPECKAHSYASGRPKDDPSLFDPHGDIGAERSRATMWDVPRFAEVHDYELIVIENVVQAVEWGPKHRKGSQFLAWLYAMEGLDYEYQLVSFNSAFAGVPQSRDRLYVVFWKRGAKKPDLEFCPPCWCPECEHLVGGRQTWKSRQAGPRAGRYGQQYFYACPECAAIRHKTVACWPKVTPAAVCLDFDLPAQRIGDREKPLSPATMARIERGLHRLQFGPVLVPLDRQTRHGQIELKAPRSVHELMRTMTGRSVTGLVVQVGGNLGRLRADGSIDRAGLEKSWPTGEPFRTVHGSNDKALVMANMEHNVPRLAGAEPMGAVTTGNRMAAIFANRGGDDRDRLTPVEQPSPTQTTINSLYLLIDQRGFSHDGSQPRLPEQPFSTVCASGNHHGLIVRSRGTDDGDPHSTQEPLPTICASGNHHGLIVRSHGSPHYEPGRQGTLRTTDEAFTTVSTKNAFQLVLPYNRTSIGRDAEQEPMDTVTATDPAALVSGDRINVEDCGFRMVQPIELGRAQDFHDSYIVHGTKRDRVKQYGNAVTASVEQMLLARGVEALS